MKYYERVIESYKERKPIQKAPQADWFGNMVVGACMLTLFFFGGVVGKLLIDRIAM